LILRKISKFDATRCHILRLKCTKFDFRWGAAPDPAGELTGLPSPPSCFKEPTSKLREGVEEGEGNGRGEKGRRREREVKGRGREGRRRIEEG